MSMGYQVGVTPLQMVAAVSAVANGGNLIQPRVVRALIRDGKRTEVKPTVLGRVISADTAVTLTGIMEQIVERGTATYAQVDGYTIAGKTGTAAKLVNGRYSHTDYYASFVGFLPSRNPVADRHRRHRFPACAWPLRRSDCRPGVPAHCRGDAPALGRPTNA